MSRKDRKTVRLAIVRAAAKRLRCKVKEVFIRAAKGVRDLVVNLNKIPDYVISYAQEILKPKIRARPPAKRRQRYYRAAPCMSVR